MNELKATLRRCFEAIDYTNGYKYVIILNGLNIPIISLLSSPIASYCSIKRLVVENLSLLIFDH
jgi:hypothetical protein